MLSRIVDVARTEPRKLDPTHYATRLDAEGYFICEDVLSRADVGQLCKAVADIPAGEEVRRKRSVYGVRNLLEICPAVRELAADPRIRQFVIPVLGEQAFAVRAILFDKASDANWSLFWHQDNVISVRERMDVPGFVGWSRKAGVWQVQPPAAVLAGMMAIRVHLDDSRADNGPLRVLPGSHRFGWIDDLEAWKQRVPEAVCTVGCGGIVAMRPLLLHASVASDSADRRRVIHLEFANAELPHGIQWNNRVI
jgi:ectoine hydroxylase-related dioxygenase (phytanoyl-CoA dioxygenase family)